MAEKEIEVDEKDIKVREEEGVVELSNSEVAKLLEDENVDETDEGARGAYLIIG
jgi:hypothetical protein